jgi:hypothetical protein
MRGPKARFGQCLRLPTETAAPIVFLRKYESRGLGPCALAGHGILEGGPLWPPAASRTHPRGWKECRAGARRSQARQRRPETGTA